MESTRERENFKGMLNTLEDLYLLGDSSLYPLFERLHFHLNELKSKPVKNVLGEFSHLEGLFQEKINDELRGFFQTAIRQTKIDILNKMKNPTLRQMDTLLNIFPHAKILVEDFELSKSIGIEVENEKISFQGKVSLEKNLESLRDNAYALTRKLFEKKVLLTFDIFEAKERDYFEMRFNFSFSHSEEKLKIQIGQRKTLLLPIIFEQFNTTINNIQHMGNHGMYELTETFDLKILQTRKELECFNTDSVLVFHFPFLFRPISLIMRGCFSDDEKYLSEKSGFRERSYDLQFEIDLFSLLEK